MSFIQDLEKIVEENEQKLENEAENIVRGFLGEIMLAAKKGEIIEIKKCLICISYKSIILISCRKNAYEYSVDRVIAEQKLGTSLMEKPGLLDKIFQKMNAEIPISNVALDGHTINADPKQFPDLISSELAIWRISD